MDNTVLTVKESKCISLNLCGVGVEVSVFFNMKEQEFYLGSLSAGSTPKKAMADLIYEKIKKKSSVPFECEALQNENEAKFEPFIMAILVENTAIKKIYDELDLSYSVCERFAIAYNKYLTELEKKIYTSIKPTLKNLPQYYMNNISLAGKNLYQTLRRFENIYNNSDLQKTFVASQYTTKIMENIQAISTTIARMCANIISSLQTYGVTEEEKNKLIAKTEKWGRWGWTSIPMAKITLFHSVPEAKKDADKIALKYFNKNGMKDLFKRLTEQKVKRKDLNEAIFCYNYRQYKACSLLLFGLIDAKLIRVQKLPEGKDKKVGLSAVWWAKKRTKKYEEKKFLYRMLRYVGVFEALTIFFEDTKNFKIESMVLNRNYIDHGMNRKNVRKKDCIQLFLLLYNLCIVLEYKEIRELIKIR